MVWIDYVFLGALALGLLYGLWRGLVMQIMNIVGMVLAVVMAGRLSRHVGGLLGYVSSYMVQNEWLANKVGYAIIFLLVLIAAKIIGHFMRNTLKRLRFGPWDRILGGAAGLLFAYVACAAFAMTLVPDDGQEPSAAVRDSRMLHHFVSANCHTGLINSDEKIDKVERLRALLVEKGTNLRKDSHESLKQSIERLGADPD